MGSNRIRVRKNFWSDIVLGGVTEETPGLVERHRVGGAGRKLLTTFLTAQEVVYEGRDRITEYVKKDRASDPRQWGSGP